MPQPIVPSSQPNVRRSSRVNKNRALNSDAQAQQSGATGTPGSPSRRKRPEPHTGSVQTVPAQATNPVPHAPQQSPAKRRRVASTSKTSKGTSTPAAHKTDRPPPPTLSASNQGLAAGKTSNEAAAARSAGQPARMSDLDARIQAKINARAQVAHRLAQTPPTSATPKDRALDAIIRAKIQARADTLGSPSAGSPAALATASPSASTSHHRPPRLLGSPGSRGIAGASPGISGHAAAAAGTSGPAGRPKRSERQHETQARPGLPRRSVYVEIPRRAPLPRVSTQLNARSSDKANLPPPQLSSSLPSDAWLGSGSSPADNLSARIEAKIRARAEKAEARRLSLEASAQVTTPSAPAMDALTAKIHAKIQARAKEQAERRLSQGIQSAQTLIRESGSPAARLSESGTRSALGPPPASGPVLVGARRAKADSAKTGNPKKRKSRNTNDVDTQQVSARAPPSVPLGLEGLAPDPHRSRDVSLVSPQMASPVPPGSTSGPGAARRSLILSDSESTDTSSAFSPRGTRPSQSEQVSRTSSASVSDILASSPGPFSVGLPSPPSEMTFLIPSSPSAATETAAEASTSAGESETAAATTTAHARSRWMHRSPTRRAHENVTGVGAASTPQLVRAGPRWTVTTPRP